MQIKKADLADLNILMKLYEEARTFMKNHGNPTQWGNSYPSNALLAQDIKDGNLFVCEEHGKIIAAFYYKAGKDDSYAKIYHGQWPNALPYGVVHRIASNKTIHGTASFCLNYALEQCGNLRIDTHRDNKAMQHILNKNDFNYCGIIYIEDGSERMAYQKTL